MTPVRHHPIVRIRQVLAARCAALREDAEGGQALILALIIVLLIGLLPVAILSSLDQELPYASESINFESSLAAAEAGVQEYANLMDQYPGYYNFAPQAGGATTTNDPGLPGGSNAALGSWAAVAGTNPPEYFTYYPDTSLLTGSAATQSASNPFGGDVLLVVTGRAGVGKATQYRRIEAAFTLTGVLTDVYWSNYEQPAAGDLDQWENTYNAGCTGGCGTVTNSHEFDEATTLTPCGSTPTPSNCYTNTSGQTLLPMATALCQYDAASENTFIDWYSQNVSPIYPQPGYPNHGTPYNTTTNKYYGPWYGAFPDLNDTAYQFGQAPTSGSTNNGDQSACNTNYWITGDTFNGPVYSQDELTTCGAPAFTGQGNDLTTAISSTFGFPATATVGWPGAKKPQLVAGTYVSEPYGYNWDPWGDCGGGTGGTPNKGVNAPSFVDPQSPHFGVSQSLPSANQGLLSEIEAGTVAGCVYTGPTMIRFSYNTTTQAETMSVWSPLTKQTYGVGSPGTTAINTANNVNCGAIATTGSHLDLCGGTSCTATNTQITGSGVGTVQAGNFAQVPVSPGLVIAVQSAPSGSDPNAWTPSTLPAAESNATISGCIDPWVNPDSPSSSATPAGTCVEGDAIISGAVSFQTTVSAANDIVVARSLVYGCAVNSNGTYSASLAGCQSSSDVLGLIAANDVWMARPLDSNGNDDPTCGTLTGVLADPNDNTDLPPSSVLWSDMIPTDCTVSNPIIDAASAALTGFFEVEYWREGSNSGTLTFNGSDAVNNAGQFGVFSSGGGLQKGYLLDLNYDSRLLVDPPPQYLPATDGVWAEAGWVTCGSTVPNPFTTGYPSGVPACTALPGSYAP